MTILPSKKERNNSKTGVNSDPHSDKDHIGHSNHPHHGYHHSSPPRWSRNERGSSNVVNTGVIENTSDSSKRSSSDNDVISVHSIDSGPSHGSKRRQRENRYNNLGYPSTRSKTSPNSSSASLNNGSTSDGLEIRATTSSVDISSVRVNTTDDNPEPNAVVPLIVAVDNGVSVEGYNSGDEYDKSVNWSAEELEEMERRFEKKMRKKGFIIKKMGEDGACLFRAVADQVYGDQDMHPAVRKLCMDYMAKNADYFSQYVTEDFNDYIQRKSLDHSHGNHVEIQALSEMYNRPIEVYHYSTTPINIFQGCQQTENEPIRLSYHQNIHYNSVVNPFKATVGVGLGLPAYKPGLAEKNLMDKAIRVSEEHELEKAMLEDKLRATDWEATNEAIEEQVARESYVEWLRENEKRAMKKKSKLTATATSTSNQQQSQSPSRSSPKASSSGTSDGNSPIARDFSLIETASFVNQFPPQLFGISDWEASEESDIIARVLAQSQQEYLDSLKRNVNKNVSDSESPENDSLLDYQSIGKHCSSPGSSKLD